MKLFIFLLITFFIIQNTYAAPSDDFVIRVQTNFLGVTGADQFKIPTLNSLTYNYDVDCNDDTINEAVGVTGDYICDYSSLGGAGIYTIRIKSATGTGFPRIYFNGGGDKNKITSVVQWGKNKWVSMNSAFEGAIHLSTTAADSPDLSNTNSLAEMFKDATSVNPNTTNWNTSTITSFTGMFQGATSANPNVSSWNTALVQRFKYMFDGASSANPNTSLWDSANVLQMEYMFRNATSANPNLTNWNIENVTSIQGMFEGVTLPTSTYDTILSTFALQNVNSSLSFDGGNSNYCAQAAHDILDIDKSWTLTDAGLDSNCPNDFVITVKTDNPGFTIPEMFRIPTKGGLTYNYNVDCNNDGINEATAQIGDYFCDYSASGLNLGAGTYTIRIKDNTGTNDGFPSIYFNNTFDRLKIISVEQWGTAKWASMTRAFTGASNLTTTAADMPDFSNMTSVVEMFRDATSAIPNTSNWDMTSIQQMGGMFSNATLANPDTSNWDVSSVSSMVSMFISATSANPDTSNWNIENVTNMNNMFNGVTLPTADYDAMLTRFSQQSVKQNVVFHGGNSKYCAQSARDILDIDNSWTITDGGLDSNCPDPLDDFVISVKTDNTGTSANNEFTIPTEPGSIYNYSVDCNNDGNNEIVGASADYTCLYPTAGTYTVRIKYNKVTNSGFPRIYFNGFGDTEKLLSIQQWGTNPWESMNSAFEGALNLTTTSSASPDLSNASSLAEMFKNTSSATPDTTNWNTSTITSFTGMFYGAIVANPNTSNWDTSMVEHMQFMFYNAEQATPDTSNWDTSKVSSMTFMFSGATNATPNTSNWVTSQVLSMANMFSGATNATPDTSNWDTSKVKSMSYMFHATDQAEPNTSNWDTTLVENFSFMFRETSKANPDTSGWNTSSAINMQGMFMSAHSAIPDTSNWDTSQVTAMNTMFNLATKANPDTSNWDTSQVTTMNTMFNLATSANPDTSNWDITKVTTMVNMFASVTLPTADYDSMLIGFSQQNVKPNVIFHGGNSKYCAQNARDILDNNWSITDGGLDSNCPFLFDDFIITIKTDNLGASADNEFIIPTKIGETYDYSVDCDNDGVNEIVGVTGDYTCVYPSAGTYTLRIKYNPLANAGFPQIYFNNGGDKDKLLTIDQWGTNPWISMDSAFEGASHLTIDATDNPDFSNMTSMFQMFKDATSINPDTSNWNIENITTMDQIFSGVTFTIADYDAILIGFSQQNVQQSVKFHGGNSKYCAQMAHNILDIDNSWTITDTGLDTNCPDPLGDFVITVKTDYPGSSADNEFKIPTSIYYASYDYSVDCDNDGINEIVGETNDYTCVYASAGTYTVRIKHNQITNSGFPSIRFEGNGDTKKLLTIEQWGTTPWRSMAYAFEGASNLTTTAADIPDFSNANSLSAMFKGATLVTPDTSNWDTSEIIYIGGMFLDTDNANPDTTNWNVSKVQFMNYMFSNAIQANPDTTNWNTSEVVNMINMFSGATAANPDVSAWNTSMVENMDSMFSGANLAIPNISNWDVSGITVPDSMESMLNGITLPRALYDTTLANFEAQVTATGIVFDAGNSKYCNVTAHDSLITTHGWTITDGGLDTNCPPLVEDIFSNGFEDVIIFKSTEAQFVYDFSQVSVKDLDENPLLIAKGLNNHHQPTLLIYLRNDLGQLQIRQDFIGEENQWIQGMWESIENKTNTLIHWNKTRFSQQIK